MLPYIDMNFKIFFLGDKGDAVIKALLCITGIMVGGRLLVGPLLKKA
jgi:hypothetical protein